MGSAFVRFRAAWMVGNLFEFPVWTICGFLIPLALLPGWVEPVAWVLAPTWGMSALRNAALGGSAWPDIGMCIAALDRLRRARRAPAEGVPPARPRARDAGADVKSLRVFAIGGWLSYRALFSWLQPSLFVMVLLIPSVTQMIFFVFLGRAAAVENDTFFIVGNALVAAAVPCLFAMSQTIAEERFTLTLPALVVSPANRVALFLGRAFPRSSNGAIVAAFALVVGVSSSGSTSASPRCRAWCSRS